MSEFQTSVNIPPFSTSIDYMDPILSIGSCFAENIGNRLEEMKFQVFQNPCGVIYNPISIQTCLRMLLENYAFSEKDIFQHQGLWHSWWHHGHFSAKSSSLLLKKLNRNAKNARLFLLQSNRILLTFGTAFVWERAETEEVIANCHKLPTSYFNRRRLSVEEITKSYFPLLVELKKQLPQLEIITTVSPIRHTREGFIENQKSKSTLILALAELSEKLEFVHYFPSYEMMMDELRDYRFYAKDMLHPSDVAIDFIWKKFQETFFKESTLFVFNEIAKIRKASLHRPFEPLSEQHQTFVNKQLKKIHDLEVSYPFLDFGFEKENFNAENRI